MPPATGDSKCPDGILGQTHGNVKPGMDGWSVRLLSMVCWRRKQLYGFVMYVVKHDQMLIVVVREELLHRVRFFLSTDI